MESKISADTVVSTTELACILGITGRRVRQLAEDGQLPKIGQGRFALGDSVQRYIGTLSEDPLDEEGRRINRERRRAEADIQASKATIAQMEARELQRKMHRAEDVAAMTEDLICTIEEAMNELPGRLAVDVAAAGAPAEVSEIVRKEVYRTMRELSGYRYDRERYEARVRSEKRCKNQ